MGTHGWVRVCLLVSDSHRMQKHMHNCDAKNWTALTHNTMQYPEFRLRGHLEEAHRLGGQHALGSGDEADHRVHVHMHSLYTCICVMHQRSHRASGGCRGNLGCQGGGEVRVLAEPVQDVVHTHLDAPAVSTLPASLPCCSSEAPVSAEAPSSPCHELRRSGGRTSPEGGG